MSADPGELSHEELLVQGWRIHQLLREGVPLEQAEAMCEIPDCHHAVRDLVGHGCNPLLAAKIVG